MKKRYRKSLASPAGKLILLAEHDALVAVLWGDLHEARMGGSNSQERDHHPILLRAQEQLLEYFNGRRRKSELPLKFSGTDFQIQVWTALGEIPFGETRTYGDLARSIGSPNACRAVGTSNGKNLLSIIIPCHRVIGANGKLTGFAGGLRAKDRLLKHERKLLMSQTN